MNKFFLGALAVVCLAGWQSVSSGQTPILALPVESDPSLAGTPGLAGKFFDSGGDVNSIEVLFTTGAAPDRTFVSTAIDYPNGGGHNTQADSSGLINFLGTDAATLMPNVNVSNIDNSRYIFSGFLKVTSDMDLTPGGPIDVRMQVQSDDDSRFYFGPVGGVGEQEFPRNAAHSLSFTQEGLYEFNVLFQEGGGNTGITLTGDFANLAPGQINNAQSVIPGSSADGFLFQDILEPPPPGGGVPEPASIAIWSLIGLGLAGFGYYRFRPSRK